MKNKDIVFTVLGSGSAIPFDNRVSSSYLIDFNGQKILLDAGFCVVYRLNEIGVSIEEIDAVFITHKHPDHFMGLIHILFALKSPFYKNKKPLKIFGFKGLTDYLKGFEKVLGNRIKPDCDVEIIEDEKGIFNGVEYELFPVKHTEEAVSVLLKKFDKNIFYTGDTEYFKDLSKYCSYPDLLVADCASNKENPVKGHMHYEEALRLAKEMKTKNLLLSHFYPNSADFTINALKYDFSILKAYDLMKIYL